MEHLKQLKGTLKAQARLVGAELFGVADLTAGDKNAAHNYRNIVEQYPRAISIGIPLLNAVVDSLLTDKDSKTAVLTYHYHVHQSINAALDRAALLVSLHLQQEGFNAYPVPASQIVDQESQYGLFSHKLAANLAGLGWIGKNCLLINPTYGPRLRLVTVLTDALLPADQPINGDCGTCSLCVDQCPAQALTGIAFHPAHSRNVRFKPELCAAHSRQRKEGWNATAVNGIICGICMAICPYGRTDKDS